MKMARLVDDRLASLFESAKAGNPNHKEIFHRIILCKSPSWGLAIAQRLGLLDSILPELAKCKGVLQNPYHHLPVFEHTLLTVDFTERIAGKPELFFPKAPALYDVIRENRTALILAALCHDLGKPETREKKEDGYYSFYRHEQLSGEIFNRLALRLELDPKLTEKTEILIVGHMRPAPIAVGYAKGEVKQKALSRLLRQFPHDWPLLVALALADTLATKGPLAPKNMTSILADFANILFELEKKMADSDDDPCPVDGKLIMRTFNLEQGPKVGRILLAARQLHQKNPTLTADQIIWALKKVIR